MSGKYVRNMSDIRYLFRCYWRTVKRGKPNGRAFRNLIAYIMLYFKCVELKT